MPVFVTSNNIYWGAALPRGCIHASYTAAPGSNLGSRVFSNVAELNDSALLRQWTVQSLIVGQTHPVLASGKASTANK